MVEVEEEEEEEEGPVVTDVLRDKDAVLCEGWRKGTCGPKLWGTPERLLPCKWSLVDDGPSQPTANDEKITRKSRGWASGNCN